MQSEIVFISWKKCFLAEVARRLVEQYPGKNQCNLRELTLIVPVARAGRRLLELMVLASEEDGRTLIPPRFLTVGSLPELLYESKAEVASASLRRLSWLRAIRSLDPVQFSALALKELTSFSEQLALSAEIESLYVELSAENLSFQDVACKGQALEGFAEEQRWQLLEEIKQRYINELQLLEMCDPHLMRMQALGQGINTVQNLVLVGVAELSGISRSLLEQAAGHLQTYVYASEEHAAGFDKWGCINTEYWAEFEVPLLSEQIQYLNDPRSEAQALAYHISNYASSYAPGEISVGVTDAGLIPFVREALEQRGVRIREAAGTSMQRSSVFQLLQITQIFLQSKSFKAFGSLCRHPDILRYLEAKLGFTEFEVLTLLDRYHQNHIQALIQSPDTIPGADSVAESLRQIAGQIFELISVLDGNSDSFDRWADNLACFVIEILQSDFNNLSDDKALTVEACELLRRQLIELKSLPDSIKQDLERGQAFTLLLEQLGRAQLAHSPGEDLIEILGWLEVPLDDARALVVLGCNEGYLPENISADAFLPNSLRTLIGLADNHRRFARDCYHLSALASSKEAIKLLAARTDQQSNVLLPSRLLFQTRGNSAVTLLEQCYLQKSPEFFDQENLPEPQHPPVSVLIPDHLEHGLTSVSVSAFRDYLGCPYRFYLSHVLRLETSNDQSLEMDALIFGSLAHQILQEFGKSKLADSSVAEEIEQFLLQRLHAFSRLNLRETAMPAVQLQVSQLEQRLKYFARFQARWRRQGWRIEQVEFSLPEQTSWLELPNNQVLQVRGRIDRIDRHIETGELVVIDYKTSEASRSPDEAHRRQSSWIDLQLPLYHLLLSKAGFSERIRLGYIPLSAELEEIAFQEATWSESELEEARAVIYQVAADIKSQKFWPPQKVRFDPFEILFGASGVEIEGLQS